MKCELTSSMWAGDISFAYDVTGLLINFDVSRSGMTSTQHQSFLQWLPRTLAELKELLVKAPHLKFVEIVEEITFDMFWKRYQAPVNSKKKAALTTWNRLKKADQVKAFNHIRKYEGNIQAWQTKMYAETYLNSFLWNN